MHYHDFPQSFDCAPYGVYPEKRLVRNKLDVSVFTIIIVSISLLGYH